MREFNKVWVNCVEDENLYGEYGYFSDNIDTLREHVINNSQKFWGRLVEYTGTNSSFPFMRESDGEYFRFFYHDPCWSKPELSSRIVTHRELSRWLAQGNGEACYQGMNRMADYTFTELRYKHSAVKCSALNIMVRKWDDNNWHKPTADYLGLDG